MSQPALPFWSVTAAEKLLAIMQVKATFCGTAAACRLPSDPSESLRYLG